MASSKLHAVLNTLQELRLIDRRDASTPEEMYDACLEVLETVGGLA